MNTLFEPGAAVLFMKVGTHAQEDLAAIIERKSKEIEETGYAMWGYGGSTCHPRSMVQPFAENFAARGLPIHLVMQEMSSRHFAEPVRADQFSIDSMDWTDIPPSINVRGSRYALVIERLQRVKMLLPLDNTQVSIGPSMGRIGSKYIRGQVDKACLEVLKQTGTQIGTEPLGINISLVAKLKPPYAVFLRNKV